jgi:flagellar basal-body rod modification protein FlgD
MTVAAVQNSTTAASAAGSATSASGGTSAAEIGKQFLTLLVTQLQNQDPMNPMDNSQVTTQLAQLSTAQGITDLNATVTGLVSQLQASQAMQGAALIGHEVLAQGNSLTLGGSGAAGGVDLAAAADQVKVDILDGAGNVVRSLSLGKQPAGLAQFAWDGNDASGNAVAQGTYSFKVTATAAGSAVTATPYSLEQVQSVSLDSSGVNVQLANLGSVGLSQIKQIF